MNEDVLAIGGFFFTVIVIVIGLPLVRAYVRQKERQPIVGPGDRERDERLARIETAVETMAVEIERISEGQRFVTRLLAEREKSSALPAPHEERR
jgi:hypothetical protein